MLVWHQAITESEPMMVSDGPLDPQEYISWNIICDSIIFNQNIAFQIVVCKMSAMVFRPNVFIPVSYKVKPGWSLQTAGICKDQRACLQPAASIADKVTLVSRENWGGCWLSQNFANTSTFQYSLGQDCGNSSASPLELSQSCTKPSIQDTVVLHWTMHHCLHTKDC